MMRKSIFRFGSFVLLTSLTAGAALAQDATSSTTTRTRTVVETTRNADGTFTVVEYPIGKETVVNLNPTTLIPGATGTARIIRNDKGTTINLDVAGITGDANNFNVYAIDPAGAVTMLGPLPVNNGTGTVSFTTPMDKFMIVLSPESNLATYGTDTRVVLRSAVPQGFAVVPVAGAPGHKQVAATEKTSAYNVPMLGIPSYKGKDSEIRMRFSGELQGLKGKAYINPRNDGVTQIKMRFDDMKMAPKGDRRFVLWAVSPDNKIVKLGQVINSGDRQEAEIRSETKMNDFGLFVTMEEKDVEQPTGTIVTTFGDN